MIQRISINGVMATVAYLNDAFEPVDAARATLLKAIFEDGRIEFFVPTKD